MANRVAIVRGNLEIEPLGMDRVWSFTGKLVVPMEHVLGATVDPGILDDAKGLRAPGLHVPGKWSGTFTQHGEKSFWNVVRPEQPVARSAQVFDVALHRGPVSLHDARVAVDVEHRPRADDRRV